MPVGNTQQIAAQWNHQSRGECSPFGTSQLHSTSSLKMFASQTSSLKGNQAEIPNQHP